MSGRVPIGLRRRLAAVGDASTPAPAPQGFAQLFPGWNVWQVWQSQDPIEGLGDVILNTGLSLERQLKIWVEDWIKDHAPGAAVADPANPMALRGAQIEPIPSADGLEKLQTRGDVPGLAGALQLGEQGSAAKLWTVRFFNRGQAGAVAWPSDRNYVLDAVYQPTAASPITNSAPPSSLGGAATDALNTAGDAVKVIAIGAGVVLGVVLIAAIVNGSRKASDA